MKSLFKVIFEDHTYELLGNAAGKERLLKDGMPFLEQVNTASFGSYTFNEPMNGRLLDLGCFISCMRALSLAT